MNTRDKLGAVLCRALEPRIEASGDGVRWARTLGTEQYRSTRTVRRDSKPVPSEPKKPCRLEGLCR